jgi:uncharacterized protein (DUF2236 family)
VWSVSRRVNSEIVVVLGWGRAILLQLAHPLVASAIADRSAFATDVRAYARRSMQTVGAMLRITFGTDAEAKATAEHINAIHRSISGALAEAAGVFPGGTPYTATDPSLLTWVHATLLDSLPLAYEQFVGPLTPEERDEYCLDASILADLLRFRGPAVPTTWTALEHYMSQMYASGQISVTEPARATAAALLAPATGPGSSVLAGFMRRITLGLLPRPIRDAYAFPWSASDERAFHRYVGLIRRTRAMLPAIVCEWPAARRARRRT